MGQIIKWEEEEMKQSQRYYLDLSRYIKAIHKIAEINELPLGKTIVMLIAIGIGRHNELKKIS
jgi:hypothetical protein